MAAHQVLRGTQRLRLEPRGTGPWGGPRTEPNRRIGWNRRAMREDLRRNGPVGVEFPSLRPAATRSRGMTAGERHISVLGREAVDLLSPRDGGIYVDATFGAGGYSRMILDVAGSRVIGIDRDRTAIAGGFDLVDRAEGRLTLVEDRFSNLAAICAAEGMTAVDGVVMDVGVSSMQLDQAVRGFSFRLDGRSTCGWGRR